jgi:hypothetical protein
VSGQHGAKLEVQPLARDLVATDRLEHTFEGACQRDRLPDLATVNLLGHVREVEVGQQRAHEHGDLMEVEAAEERLEIFPGLPAFTARRNAQVAHALHERERLGPLLPLDGLSEQLAQQFEV